MVVGPACRVTGQQTIATLLQLIQLTRHRTVHSIRYGTFKAGDYVEHAPAEDGWLPSGITGIQFRAEAGQKLAVQLAADPSTRQALP